MDLSKFSDEELFLSAIKNEVDSNMIYSKLAEVVKNAFLKDKLLFLANEEDKHRECLEKAFNNRFPGREIVLPEKTYVPLPELSIPEENVLVSEVIDQAMEAELAAKEFYEVFAERFEDVPDLKQLFEYFAIMELSHYRILEVEKENMEIFEKYDDYWPMMHIGT